jgi:predicted RNA-binding protein with RPS1 domain
MTQVFLYRVVGGEVEAKIFDSDDMPKSGWSDSPASAKAKPKKQPKTPKKST